MRTDAIQMKYSDGINDVHVYDIVRIKHGEYKDRLAIIKKVDFVYRYVNITIIENGVVLRLPTHSLIYCYGNTKTAAKQWFDQIKYHQAKLQVCWSDIKYIKANWTNPLSHNSVVGRTIATIINSNIVMTDIQAAAFVELWAPVLDYIFTYKNVDITIKAVNKFKDKFNNDNHFYIESVIKLHRAIWGLTSSTGEK